jgi:hypothetical protein
MLSFFKNIYRPKLINSKITKDQFLINKKKIDYNKIIKFGNKSKNKFYYIIKRNYSPTGFFSNLFFVLDHLEYALNKKFLPFVDMENFPTVYNEKNLIYNTRNSWEYYFYNFIKKKDIYNSYNVIFSNNSRIQKDSFPVSKKLTDIYRKYIKILPRHISKYNEIKSVIFKKNDKILGISISGGLQKVVRGHWLPLDPDQMLEISKKIFQNEECTKVFLVTRDLNYYDKFASYYKDKFIHTSLPRSKSSFWGSHNVHFEKYSRKDHRYKLGSETLIEGLLLSDTAVLLCDRSNISRFAFLNSNKKNKYLILSEFNSNNVFLARWLWYLKVYCPIIFGRINYKIIKYN